MGYSLSLESARLDLGFDLIVGFSDSDSDDDIFFLFVGFSLDPVAFTGWSVFFLDPVTLTGLSDKFLDPATFTGVSSSESDFLDPFFEFGVFSSSFCFFFFVFLLEPVTSSVALLSPEL